MTATVCQHSRESFTPSAPRAPVFRNSSEAISLPVFRLKVRSKKNVRQWMNQKPDSERLGAISITNVALAYDSGSLRRAERSQRSTCPR